jgi:DNA polymerase
MNRGGKIDHILEALDDIKNGKTLGHIMMNYGSPMIVASELIRPTFIAPPGMWLVGGDYSQIEDRVNNWQGGQEEQLEAFRKYDAKTGPDPYRVTAGAIYGIDPLSIEKDDPRRQVGKVARLACGFGGGRKAILKMAQIYNVKMTEERAEEIKNLWREHNPGIKQFWRTIEDASLQCVRGPVGNKVIIGHGASFARGQQVLIMRGPSGSSLIYWYPHVERVETPWGIKDTMTFWSEDAMTHRWCKFYSYGGMITENLTQFTSRCLTADSLIKLEDAGYPPVLTVHDENVVQASKQTFPDPREAEKVIRGIMMQAPDWAAGVPINVACVAADKYMKA